MRDNRRPAHAGLRLARALVIATSLLVSPHAMRAQAAPAAPVPAGGDSGGVRLYFPARVADFTLTARQHDQSRNEVHLRFTAPDSVRADVFIYPGPDFAGNCDSACAAAAMEREVADFHGLFPEMLRRKYVDSIAVESNVALAATDESSWRLGHHVVLATRRAGHAERSELHLFYLPRARVKIRTSYRPTPARVSAVAAFAEALVPALLRPPEGAPTP